MPKTVDTRMHCEVGLRDATIFHNLKAPKCRDGVVEYCCMLSTLPRSVYSYRF